jgi:hypothetical protein
MMLEVYVFASSGSLKGTALKEVGEKSLKAWMVLQLPRWWQYVLGIFCYCMPL